MTQNIMFATFVFGAVLLLWAFIRGGLKLFGSETSRERGHRARPLARAAGAIFVGVALWPTNGGSTPPTQTSADKSRAVFPAGVISDNEDSVQILDVSPEPGTYLRRLEPRVFKMKIAYNLESADVALLSMSIAQSRERGGCTHLPDSTRVEIKRGRHIVDIDLEWTGDTGAKSKGLVDMKGYLRFVPMFWRSESGRRGERIRVFEGYEKVCMRFGP